MSKIDAYKRILSRQEDPDMGFKIGDLVTCHYAGYWIIENIIPRFVETGDYHNQEYVVGSPMPSLIVLRKIADKRGNKTLNSKRKKTVCVTYCTNRLDPISIQLICNDELQEARRKMNNLIDLYNETR